MYRGCGRQSKLTSCLVSLGDPATHCTDMSMQQEKESNVLLQLIIDMLQAGANFRDPR